jgi:DNA repair protein RecO
MHKKHIKDELIILKRFPINESDLLIIAFGKHCGKITLKAKGSKKINSKFTGKLEPLSLINAEIYFSGKSFTLTNAINLCDPPLAENIETFNTSQKICSVLVRTLPNEEAHIELFNELKEIIQILISQKKSSEALTIFYALYIKLTGHLAESTNTEENKNLSKNAIKVIKFYSMSRPNQSIKLILPIETQNEVNNHLENILENSLY